MDLFTVIGLILGLLGIFLTILLSEPIIARIQQIRQSRKRNNWSANLQVDKNIIRLHENYAFEFWWHVIEVDKDGNAVHSVDARIVNIGDHLLTALSFPVYCDARDVEDRVVNPWAKFGVRRLAARLEHWIPEHARGVIKINLNPPMAPGSRHRIRWGYFLPQTFRTGDEYYNWDISTPHFDLGGEIRFEPSWKILYARWDGEAANRQAPPTCNASKIVWSFHFPKMGERITMRFGLGKQLERIH